MKKFLRRVWERLDVFLGMLGSAVFVVVSVVFLFPFGDLAIGEFKEGAIFAGAYLCVWILGSAITGVLSWHFAKSNYKRWVA